LTFFRFLGTVILGKAASDDGFKEW